MAESDYSSSEEDAAAFFQRESTMDQKLLRALRQGDKHLFNELVRNARTQNTGKSRQANTTNHNTETSPQANTMSLIGTGISGQVNTISLSTGRSPQGNTILHIAARLGNNSPVEEILQIRPSLVQERNYKGETPMHIAATAGYAGIVRLMMTVRMKNQQENNILQLADNGGNTPLHNAVRNDHLDLVQILILADPKLVLYKNQAGQSPLSIAIDASSTDIARWIISKYPNSVNPRYTNQQTVLHSAVIRRDLVVMVEILKANRELIHELDKHERNALHYAAASGHVQMAHHLLKEGEKLRTWYDTRTNNMEQSSQERISPKEAASLVYQQDYNGQTPLHVAAGNGHLCVFKLLHNYCLDAIELLDKRRRNVLHLAAKYGKVNILEFVSKLPEMEDLINFSDKHGNTPLHLAAKYLRSDVIYFLSRNVKVNFNAINRVNQTAIDIAESQGNHQERELQKHLTIKALKTADADRALNPKKILGNRGFSVIEHRGSRRDDQKGIEGKGMAKTLSLMATLIATFTFTAAFTIPGGYKNDGPDEGMATLVRRASFQAFVITDAVAMTSSMTAAVVVFWSFWRSKSESFMDALPLAIFLTWIGLVSMAVAFVTGLFVVLSSNMALAIAASSIACFLPLIFYVLTPFILLLRDQSAASEDHVEVNPFAFSLRMVNILVRNPLNQCLGRCMSKSNCPLPNPVHFCKGLTSRQPKQVPNSETPSMAPDVTIRL